MYLMANRRISFLLSFFSGGYVGTSLRSSANAPLTFCWRQRSRLLLKVLRGKTINGRPDSSDVVVLCVKRPPSGGVDCDWCTRALDECNRLRKCVVALETVDGLSALIPSESS